MGEKYFWRETIIHLPKILILAEGQTEEIFIKQTLALYLSQFGIDVIPKILTTKRTKSGLMFKGGISTYEKVRKDLIRLLNDSSANLVTSMIDYYGLPNDFPGKATLSGGSPLERVKYIEAEWLQDIGNGKFLPYCSLHEFESLLFSSPASIAQGLAIHNRAPEFALIRQAFLTPEDINDHPQTVPSARITKLFSGYSKPVFGPQIAARIGIQEMRKECRHFNWWLSQLEAFGKPL